MRINRWKNANLHRIGLLGLLVLFICGCQGPQGPDWKEQVTQSLEHYYKGEEEQKKGNIEAAEKEYLAALELSPRPIIYVRLAQIQSQDGRTGDAIASLDQAIRLSPGFQRAIVYKKQLMLRQSGNDTEISLPVSGSSTEDSFNVLIPGMEELVTPVSREEKIENAPSITPETESVPSSETTPASKAVPAIESVSSPVETPIIESPVSTETAPAALVEPEKTSIQNSTGNTPRSDNPQNVSLEVQAKEAAKNGDWKNAQSLYEKILTADSSNAVMQYNYAYTCFNLNQLAQAETAFRRAVELDPQFADAYNDLGVTLEKQKKSGEAVEAYQKAVDLGTNSDAFFNLALLKEKLGQYKASVELYEKYLTLDSDSTFADYARQRIEKLRRLAY